MGYGFCGKFPTPGDMRFLYEHSRLPCMGPQCQMWVEEEDACAEKINAITQLRIREIIEYIKENGLPNGDQQ